LITLLTESDKETLEVGRLLGARLGRGMFVGLSGDLGGGKTTITRGIARGLGIEAAITSPTFQLLREYEGRERLYHFDFYRLGGESDLLDLDIIECLRDGVVVAEWADMFSVPDVDEYLIVKFYWEGENRRRIEFAGASAGAGGILEEIEPDLRKFGLKKA